MGQRLGPSEPLPALAEFTGGPKTEDPAHGPETLRSEHSLPPQPQPPDAQREVRADVTLQNNTVGTRIVFQELLMAPSEALFLEFAVHFLHLSGSGSIFPFIFSLGI